MLFGFHCLTVDRYRSINDNIFINDILCFYNNPYPACKKSVKLNVDLHGSVRGIHIISAHTVLVRDEHTIAIFKPNQLKVNGDGLEAVDYIEGKLIGRVNNSLFVESGIGNKAIKQFDLSLIQPSKNSPEPFRMKSNYKHSGLFSLSVLQNKYVLDFSARYLISLAILFLSLICDPVPYFKGAVFG